MRSITPWKLDSDADRQLQADRLAGDAVDDVGDALEEVGADLVHLVDEHDARHVVLVGLAPHGLGLRLDALVAVEHADGAVEHAQRALDLDGEVDVAGGVDDVQALLAPEARRRGGRDRDAALLLLLHPVHGGGALMDFADLVGLSGVVEDPLGRRGLAGIDVGHDAEVAVVLDRVRAGHRIAPERRRNRLPAVVREGAVGLGHPVRVFPLLDGVAAVVGGVEQLGGEALDHGPVVARAGGLDQPADRQRLAALGAHLDRDLVGRAADAAGAHLDHRGDVVEGGAEHLDRVRPGRGSRRCRRRRRRSARRSTSCPRT